MTQDEAKTRALDLVANPNLSPTVEALIENAKKIEAYLLGKDK